MIYLADRMLGIYRVSSIVSIGTDQAGYRAARNRRHPPRALEIPSREKSSMTCDFHDRVRLYMHTHSAENTTRRRCRRAIVCAHARADC